MLWLMLACQDASDNKPQTVPTVQQEKKQTTNPDQNHIEMPQDDAPKASPSNTSIDTSAQVVVHPPPLEKRDRPVIDVCVPYGKLLQQEKFRGTSAASEKERLSALRELNQILEYHPSDTAQAIVELEKEVLVGPIHLSLEERQLHWYRIHSYIGSICRADISKIVSPKK